MGGAHAVQDKGRVGALVLEADGRRFQRGGPPGGHGRDARRHPKNDQDARGDEHRQRRALPAGLGLPRLLVRLGGHLRLLPRRVAEAVEDAGRDPEHRARGEHRAGAENGREPGAAGDTVRAVSDPSLAEERAERRQVSQAERGQREHDPGDPQVLAPAVQPGFVDRVQPVQDDARAEEQRALHERVAEHGQRGARQAERGEQREPGAEHAGVADRGERQQPFDVSLAEAEQRADDRGEHAEDKEPA